VNEQRLDRRIPHPVAFLHPARLENHGSTGGVYSEHVITTPRAGRPDGLARTVVDNEIAIGLHDGTSGAGASCTGAPKRNSIVSIHNEVSFMLQRDEVTSAIGKKVLASGEQLAGSKNIGVGSC
jgi:hypothetical protein